MAGFAAAQPTLARLDGFEAGYERLKVTVFDEDNQAIEAITHIRGSQIQVQEGKPSPKYLAVIQQGYKDWRLA